MAIGSIQAPLQSQIASALKLNRGAAPGLVSVQISQVLAGLIPAGQMPIGPAMVPLIPSGVAATKSQIENSFKLNRGATPDLVGQIIGGAISVLSSMVPPSGLSTIKSQLTSAFKMERGATPDLVARVIASAIITYYQIGGVV